MHGAVSQSNVGPDAYMQEKEDKENFQAGFGFSSFLAT